MTCSHPSGVPLRPGTGRPGGPARRGRVAPLLRAALGLAVVLTASCDKGGGSLNPVKGKVLVNDEPAKGVLVTFQPKKEASVHTTPSTGVTGEDGTFTLSTGSKQGAPAGEYVVTFIWSEEVPNAPKGKVISMEPPETRDRLGGAYASRDRSRFTVEVKAGTNELAEPFKLQMKK